MRVDPSVDVEAKQQRRVASAHRAISDYHASLARPDPVTTPVVECINGAIVCPESHIYRNDAGVVVLDGGVFHPDGRLCDLSVHRACDRLHVNVPVPPASACPCEVSGTHLYGGVLLGHFGHFLLESLSRLWALDEYGGQIETVVCLKSRGLPDIDPSCDVPLPRFIRDTLALLGIPETIVVHGVPVRFERLIVPSQLLGTHLFEGHAAIHSFMKRRLSTVEATADVLPNGCRDIYISRRKMCDGGGAGILCEHVVEGNMRNYGYHVVYPEDLTVEEQLGIYNHCDRIVFAASSAIHLFALVAQDHQRAFIINRKRDGSAHLLRQVRGSGRGHVEQFDGITERLFRRSAANWMEAENTSVAVLDFDLLGSALMEQGFIPDTARWRAPTDDDLREQITAIDPVGD